MTEKEARMKWCPFARVRSGMQNSTVAANRNLLETDRELVKCLASSCMAWRRNEPRVRSLNDDGTVTFEPDDGSGYCGLAGKP
jgi:hypothetical protein